MCVEALLAVDVQAKGIHWVGTSATPHCTAASHEDSLDGSDRGVAGRHSLRSLNMNWFIATQSLFQWSSVRTRENENSVTCNRACTSASPRSATPLQRRADRRGMHRGYERHGSWRACHAHVPQLLSHGRENETRRGRGVPVRNSNIAHRHLGHSRTFQRTGVTIRMAPVEGIGSLRDRHMPVCGMCENHKATSCTLSNHTHSAPTGSSPASLGS